MSALNELRRVGVPALPSVEILQPAKHGYVVDIQDGTRRTQVRVFEFEEQPFQGGMVEMPVVLTVPVAIQRFREAMEALRESISRPEAETERTGVSALPSEMGETFNLGGTKS